MVTLGIVLLQSMVWGQAECTLTKSELPTIRKLRLGMTLSEVKKLYPKMRTTHLGFIEGAQYPDAIKSPYSDVASIDISIENNQLVAFGIRYAPLIKWDSETEFAHQVIDNLGLKVPKTALDSENNMVCKDFYLRFSLNPSGRYSMSLIGKNFMEEAIKGDEKQKRSFKP